MDVPGIVPVFLVKLWKAHRNNFGILIQGRNGQDSKAARHHFGPVADTDRNPWAGGSPKLYRGRYSRHQTVFMSLTSPSHPAFTILTESR